MPTSPDCCTTLVVGSMTCHSAPAAARRDDDVLALDGDDRARDGARRHDHRDRRERIGSTMTGVTAVGSTRSTISCSFGALMVPACGARRLLELPLGVGGAASRRARSCFRVGSTVGPKKAALARRWDAGANRIKRWAVWLAPTAPDVPRVATAMASLALLA